ncbi:streptococcal hemagglutinin-like isoform X1 [Dermacentor albipictus]|uniref:streptococcal hemagglutinin-like isoform X1 n=1 Tax=Dermacentor albipictus TaxID=60249 RepID=UPI0031FDCBB9
MARGGAKKVHCSNEAVEDTCKGSGVSHSPKHVEACSGLPPRVEVKKSSDDEEAYKSEELSDIINFLIETDPRRSRESRGVLDASSDDTERSFSPPVPPCAQKPDGVCPSPPNVKRAREDVANSPPPPSSTASAATSPLRIVLPAPDIYGFNYQPDYAFRSVASTPSQAKGTLADAKCDSEASLHLAGTTQDAEMSKPGGSDETGDIPVNGSDSRCVEADDKCQVPSATEAEIREKTTVASSPVNNDVAEKDDIDNKGCAQRDSLIVKPDGDICQDDTADSRSIPDSAVALGRPVASANCDDGRAADNGGAALDLPAYPDARPRCVEEDSRVGHNGSPNDGDTDRGSCAPEERELRTPAKPATSPPPDACSESDASEARQGELEDVEKRPPASPPARACDDDVSGDVVSTAQECSGLALPDDHKTACNSDSDAESDSTEALQWSPDRASRSNSAEYSREGGATTVDGGADDASENVVASAAGPSNRPVTQIKEEDTSPLLNGTDDLECSDKTVKSIASACTRSLAPSDGGLDNLISVFTTVEEGKIVSVDCKKFRKRGRPLGAKKKNALKRARMAAMEMALQNDDVDFTVKQLLHDMVDRIAMTGGEIPSKLSEANLKDVISSFCESNGFSRQEFACENDEICFGSVLRDEHPDATGGAAKRPRRGSSDHGSSSEQSSQTPRPRGSGKRYKKKRETVPTKRMLTRSQWRRSCYQKEQQQDGAATDHPDNGLLVLRDGAQSLPDAKRRRRSVDLASDLDSSNTESTADGLSSAWGASQEMDLSLTADEAASCGAGYELRPAPGASDDAKCDGDARVLVAEGCSSAPVNSSIYLSSSEPPKLGYMELSVTTAPRELSPLVSARSGAGGGDRESAPRDVQEADARGRGHSHGRQKQQQPPPPPPPPQYGLVSEHASVGVDDENDDDGESQLVICDTDDSSHDAPPPSAASGVRGDSAADTVRATLHKSEVDAHSGARASRQRRSPPRRLRGASPAANPARQRLGGGAGAVCESEKAATDAGVVCLDDGEGDNIGTPEASVVAAAGVTVEGSSRHLRSPPPALSSVRGSPAAPSASDRPGASESVPTTTSPPSAAHRRTTSSSGHYAVGSSSSLLYQWPASLPTSPSRAESPDIIVVKEEPNDLSVSGRTANFVPPLPGLEPLDLSLKEQSFRAKADIPVGKVQPQMATTSQSASEEAVANSPINYSASSRHVPAPRAEEDTRSKERDRRGAHGSDSNSSNGSPGAAGTAGTSEPASDSILQRLLLDPSRKPKESDSSAASSPVQVALETRNARGSAEPTKDSAKRGRDTDIVNEAKSLLNARLTARHQEQQLQQQQQQQHQHQQQQPPLVKASNMASVPPMSFPENKLGMSTLESKIVELKKQIHHLTILATYKEKELACISTLRTAKEDALKQLESKYPGICSVIRAFGPDSGSGESSDSPGFTDVPSIVAQAATATADLTSLGAGLASETDPPLQKKPAVQAQPQPQHSPALPIPLLAGTPAPHRLRANSGSERDSPGRGLMSYDRASAAAAAPPPTSSTARSSVSPRGGDNRQPRPLPSIAPSKSAFSVPSALSSSSSSSSAAVAAAAAAAASSQRPPRLLLPKGPMPPATPAAAVPVAQTSTSRGVNSGTMASSSAAAAGVSNWWNAPNGAPLSLTAGLPHHLQRDALREYASSSSTAALLKAASVPSSLAKQHNSAAGSTPSLSRSEALAGMASDPSARTSHHQRLAEAAAARTEDSRGVAAELARQQEEFNLALSSSGSLAGVNAAAVAAAAAAAGAYPLGRAGLSAAASMYNQAMAYSLYQQLRVNKEAALAQAEASALLEKMKQQSMPSQQQQQQHQQQQQQLYQKALLEQATKNRPTAWEHISHLLQKENPVSMQAGLPSELLSLQPKLSAPEMSWLQAGLACVNCGDPRVKFVCSCCRTQTFCSEQCQAKLWSKLKTQAPTKN